MKRADVKVWFACNNLCDFCVQGDKRLHHKQRTLKEIEDILAEEFSNGCEWVVFTGGEPTIHPNLSECVRFARSLGYREIQIQSNGRNFAKRPYVEELIAAGVTEFGPSIHGFRAETHDRLVRAPGAWIDVIAGIRLLRELGQRIIINSVVTSDNFREIPALASLLIRLGVDQYQFAFVHILGTADKYKERIVPRKSEVMPYVRKALDIGRKAGVTCMTEAIPFCLMEGYEWAIAEYYFMPETTVVDAERRTDSYADHRWNEGKAKRAECEACSKNMICEGPWREYPELYGWDEFVPILDHSTLPPQLAVLPIDPS